MPRLEELDSLLRKADHAYYTKDQPVMSDVEYDKLVEEYQELTGEAWEVLGHPDEQMTRIPHVIPMLSLEKIKTIEALVKWTPRACEYAITPKIDGLSCTLRYHDGKLVQAITRGDGTVGESIFHTIQPIIDKGMNDGHIRSTITRKGEVEIRGEIFLPILAFQAVNKLRKDRYEKLFANPRNAAAGIVRRQELDHEQSFIRFVAYRLISTEEELTYTDHLLQLDRWGFLTPPNTATHSNDFSKYTAEALHPDSWVEGTLPYEIDGVVLVVNTLAYHKGLGETGHHPKWACAFKFATEEAETEILDVEWNASRTGLVVPTYVFKAVSLCGTIVTRATGHNLEQYLTLGAGIGDKVIVRKANEIIPQLVRKV